MYFITFYIVNSVISLPDATLNDVQNSQIRNLMTTPLRYKHICNHRLADMFLKWHAHKIIRINHECEVEIERYVLKITDWHNKAC